MSIVHPVQDLIVVVADSDAERAIRALLTRHESLGIRPVAFDVRRHIHRDPGCRTSTHSFLKPEVNRFARALVVFDWEGAGAEDRTPEKIEISVEESLSRSGWKNRCACVVIRPELEMWIWSDSPHVPKVLGWKDRCPPIREWIQKNTEYWPVDAEKPNRPKEALEASLRAVHKSSSSSIFEALAKQVSVERCVDRAFVKFRTVLAGWFGEDSRVTVEKSQQEQ